MDILYQMIMGSANTPAEILKKYKLLNLSMCSLNLIDIPSGVTSLCFSNVFEFCVKNHKMVCIGVYKKDRGGQVVDEGEAGEDNSGDKNKESDQAEKPLGPKKQP